MNYDITIEDLVNALCEEQGIVLWKDVPGYEGLYQVSNVGGMVRSMDRYVKGTGRYPDTIQRIKGKLLSTKLNNNGYVQVHLHKDNKCKMYLVHRLVAEAFIPNPLNLPEINHLDECQTSNNAANLEWCDRAHNLGWGTRSEKQARSMGRPVRQYTKDGEFVAEYWSAREAQRQTGIRQGGISKVCNGVIHQSGGYIWKYATEEKKFHNLC